MSNPHISLNFNLVAHNHEKPTPLSSRVLHVAIAAVATAIFYKCTGFNNFKNFRQIAQFIGGSALVAFANKVLPIAEIAQEILGTKIETTLARLEVTPKEQQPEQNAPDAEDGPVKPSNPVEDFGLEVKQGHALRTPEEQQLVRTLIKAERNAYRRVILSRKAQLLARAAVLEKPPAYIENISRVALFCLSVVGAVFVYKHTLGHISTQIQAWRYTLCDHFLYQAATMFSFLPMMEMQASMHPFGTEDVSNDSVIELEAFFEKEELDSLSVFAKKRKVEALSDAIHEILEPIKQQVADERFTAQNRELEGPARPWFFEPLLAWFRDPPEAPVAPEQSTGENVFAPELETIFQQIDALLPQEKEMKEQLKQERERRKCTKEHITQLQEQVGRGNNVAARTREITAAKELLRNENRRIKATKESLANLQNQINAARERVASFNNKQQTGVPRPMHPGIETPSLSYSYVLRTAAKISLVVASIYFLQGGGYPLLAFSIPQAIKSSFSRKYIYPAVEFILVQVILNIVIGNLASSVYDRVLKGGTE